MIKISHKAITQFATVGDGNNAYGASAIFKLSQVRPALLEKRVNRPAAATTTAGIAAAAAAAAGSSANDAVVSPNNCNRRRSMEGGGNNNDTHSLAAAPKDVDVCSSLVSKRKKSAAHGELCRADEAAAKLDIVKRSDLCVFYFFFLTRSCHPISQVLAWLVQQRSPPPRNKAHRTSKNGSDGD